MNAINVIAPYKHHGMWVFDDPRVGLVQEPFVAGADTMIDRVVAELPDAEHGFTMIFSSTPFPGHQYRLDWRRAEGGGFFGLKGGIVTSEDFAVGQKHRELEGLALGIASVCEIGIELVLGANLVIAVAV